MEKLSNYQSEFQNFNLLWEEFFLLLIIILNSKACLLACVVVVVTSLVFDFSSLPCNYLLESFGLITDCYCNNLTIKNSLQLLLYYSYVCVCVCVCVAFTTWWKYKYKRDDFNSSLIHERENTRANYNQKINLYLELKESLPLSREYPIPSITLCVCVLVPGNNERV